MLVSKYELTQQHIFSKIYITFLADFTFISKVCNYYQTISFAEKTKNSLFKHIHASTIQNGFKELSKFSKGYCFKLICDSRVKILSTNRNFKTDNSTSALATYFSKGDNLKNEKFVLKKFCHSKIKDSIIIQRTQDDFLRTHI